MAKAIFSDSFTSIQEKYLPADPATLISKDCIIYEKKQIAEAAAKDSDAPQTVTTVTVTTTTTTTVYDKRPGNSIQTGVLPVEEKDTRDAPPAISTSPVQREEAGMNLLHTNESPPPVYATSPSPSPAPSPPIIDIQEDENAVYIGLRVYTKATSAVVEGILLCDVADDSEAKTFSPPL